MMGSLALATAKEALQLFWPTLLNLLVFDHPVMVLVKETENLPQFLIGLS